MRDGGARFETGDGRLWYNLGATRERGEVKAYTIAAPAVTNASLDAGPQHQALRQRQRAPSERERARGPPTERERASNTQPFVHASNHPRRRNRDATPPSDRLRPAPPRNATPRRVAQKGLSASDTRFSRPELYIPSQNSTLHALPPVLPSSAWAFRPALARNLNLVLPARTLHAKVLQCP